MAESPAIRLDNVSHRFGRLRVLHDVDLAVRHGAIHGFVGPNGAGKSTTMRILSTLLRPTRGRATVLGVDLKHEPKRARRKIGFMPDHFAMYRRLTAFEYLDFFAAAHGRKFSARDEAIGRVIDLTDIGGFTRQLIGSLSRGMQQRVCLARVLIHDPDVLLLDEPASGLDPRARHQLMRVIRDLAGEGKTVLISSHILSELAALCDDVTIIDRGEVRFTGAMAELLGVDPSGRRRYLLELKQPVPGLVAAIAALDSVGIIERASGERYEVEFAGASAPVLELLLDRGGEVVEFTEIRRDLDEVFLELTEPGGAA